MKRFAVLYDELDSTTSTNVKVEAIARYLIDAPAADAAWALYFLTGQRLKRLIQTRQMRQWTLELAHIPEWLLDEAYSSVGDSAELCALLVNSSRSRLQARGIEGQAGEDVALHTWMEERITPLGGLSAEEQKARVLGWWSQLSGFQIFILNKLLTGSFRVGVSQRLVVRALAKVSELRKQPLSTAEISHRLMGAWRPTPETFEGFFTEGTGHVTESKPYPFFLASPLEKEPSDLSDPSEWLAEWKWDGIRAQVICRNGATHIWSRGEELISDRFPEILKAAASLPDGTVIDGEILAYQDGQVLPFAILQKRIGRKKLTPSILKEAPVALMAYDLLEQNHEDLRPTPQSERRERLERLLFKAPDPLHLSPLIAFDSWKQLATRREESRGRQVEGVMLKRKSSPYQVGRRRGDWWKWKIDPFTVDAVLLYAQAGSGRRANLFTDYTFAVWQNDALVPVAKAYSGLTDEEIGRLDTWIRGHTKDRFGPVRSVEPHYVFEIAFEGIAESPRHKSGIALRFPRILRWRLDKKPADADSIATLRELL